jgi:hypothetical protein
VPVGDQDHGRVAVAVAAVLAGAVHQPLDFLPGEVSAGSAPRNCQVYSGWCRGLGCWKHRGNFIVFWANYAIITHLLHSYSMFPAIFAASFSGVAVRLARPPMGPMRLPDASRALAPCSWLLAEELVRVLWQAPANGSADTVHRLTAAIALLRCGNLGIAISR